MITTVIVFSLLDDGLQETLNTHVDDNHSSVAYWATLRKADTRLEAGWSEVKGES